MKVSHTGLAIAFIVAISLTGCFKNNKDNSDIYEKYDKVYIAQARNNPQNRLVLFADTAQTITYNAAFAGANNPDKNITLNFSIKTALVDSFNAANTTDYSTLPERSYKLNQTKAVIPAGQRRSDNLNINLTTNGNIKAGKQYLLPINMKVENNALPVREDWGTVYFLIEGKYTTIYMPEAQNNPVKHTLDPAVDTAKTVSYSAAYIGVQGIASSQTPQSDIPVRFNVNPALVDSFNIKNSTSYPLLPEESYTLGKAEATISSGQDSTDKFNIKLMYDDQLLQIGKKYLLPVTLNMSGNSGGVRIDKNQQTTFFLIDVSYFNLDRSNWQVIASNHHQPGDEAVNMFDGDLKKTWNSGYKIPDQTPSRPAPPHYITVDMGELNTIHGFQIFGNQSQHLGQNPKKMTFEFSKDGKNWTSKEDVTTPFTLTIAKGKVYLDQTVKARYFKIEIPKGGMVTTTRKVCTIAELYAF